MGLEVAVEVVADQVVVISIDQVVDQVNECLGVATKGSTFDGLINTTKSASDVAAIACPHCVTSIFHFLHVLSEDEHVFHANLLGDLNISTVHSTDDKAAIHHKLHIGGTRSFCACSRDMLRQLGSRDNNLGT